MAHVLALIETTADGTPAGSAPALIAAAAGVLLMIPVTWGAKLKAVPTMEASAV